MTFMQFCIVFLRQSAFALALFVVFCLATETIFPGFAAPFVNIPVLALVVTLLVFAAASSSRGSADTSAGGLDSGSRGNDMRKKLSLIFVGLGCIGALAYLLTTLSPMGTIALIRFGAIACTCLLSIILFWKNPSSYE